MLLHYLVIHWCQKKTSNLQQIAERKYNGYYVTTDVTVGQRSFVYIRSAFFVRIKCFWFSRNADEMALLLSTSTNFLQPITERIIWIPVLYRWKNLIAFYLVLTFYWDWLHFHLRRSLYNCCIYKIDTRLGLADWLRFTTTLFWRTLYILLDQARALISMDMNILSMQKDKQLVLKGKVFNFLVLRDYQ